eukprot:TRINITY_DN152_c5_g1_i2.p1 TRINITY_DN152_c5_g1~~TRINITY_DN152_c5_g1_i2.p1  ORF type:complete len:987 (-),score=293.38 TRINITY_DN152_c5_g1_i2:159-3119(-)
MKLTSVCFVLLVSLSVVCGQGGTTPPQGAPSEVKIGGMFYTATSSAPDVVRGARGEGRTAFHLAIKRINDDPTLLPNTKLVGVEKNTNSQDDALTDALALSKVSECGVDESVVGIVGPAFSSHAVVSATVGKVHRTPMISPSATSPSLKDGLYPYFTRTIPADDQQGRALAAIANRLKWKSVCTISTKDTYGELGIRSFGAAAAEYGIRTLGSARLHDPQARRDGDPAARKAEEDLFVEAMLPLKGTACRAFILYTNGELDLVFGALRRVGLVGPDYSYLGSEAVAMQYENSWVTQEVMADAQGILGTDPSKGSNALKEEVTQYWAANVDTSTDSIDNKFYDDGDLALTTSGTVYAWDATYALARAIDAAIRAGDDVYDGAKLNEHIRKLNFVGITGQVKFDEQNRDGGVYEIWNGVIQDGKNVLMPVGTFDENSDEVKFLEDSSATGRKIRWGSGKVGLDAIPIAVQEDEIVVSAGARVPFFILAGIGILLAVITAAMLASKSTLPIIKRSSPEFSYLILLGCIMAYISIILYGITNLTGTVCAFRTIMLLLAFTFAFGSMFAKTYRIHAIYNAPLSQGVTVVSNKQLFAFVGALFVFDIIAFVVWQIVSPYSAGTETVRNGNALVSTQVCKSDNASIFYALFFVVKAGLLLWGVYLAVRIRKVKQKDLNEAKWIAMCIWNVGFIAILGTPILFMIGSDIRNTVAVFVLMSLLIFIAVTAIIVLLFFPKFHRIFILKETSMGEKADPNMGIHRGGGRAARGKTDSELVEQAERHKKTASELGDRVAELQRQLALSQKRETMLRETYEGTSALGDAGAGGSGAYGAGAGAGGSSGAQGKASPFDRTPPSQRKPELQLKDKSASSQGAPAQDPSAGPSPSPGAEGGGRSSGDKGGKEDKKPESNSSGKGGEGEEGEQAEKGGEVTTTTTTTPAAAAAAAASEGDNPTASSATSPAGESPPLVLAPTESSDEEEDGDGEQVGAENNQV